MPSNSPRTAWRRTNHLGEDLWIVALHGEHDLSTQHHVENALDEVRAHGTRILIDLSDATFIDSSVIHTLITTHQRAQRTPNEQVAVIAPPGTMPAHVLDVLGASAYLNIHRSQTEALNQIGNS